MPALRSQGHVNQRLRVPQHREHRDEVRLVIVPFQAILLGHGCLEKEINIGGATISIKTTPVTKGIRKRLH